MKIKVIAPKARILQVLHQSPRALSTYEVSDNASVAWATARKYLKIWENEGMVIKEKEIYHSIKHGKEMSRNLWKINREVFNKLLKR